MQGSRDHGGAGKGLAAGSVVAYTLGITSIDPMRYNLLFERFLNPERVSMPDIDVDFCFERRQEVIDYVTEKIREGSGGSDRHLRYPGGRGVIRDVGRVLDLPYALCDQIAKMVPKELNITIDEALKTPDLAEAYRSSEQVKYLIDMSRRLEGLPRHTSMHAAGVVISQKPVEEYVPFPGGGRLHHHPVHHDDPGGAGTSENGFSGAQDPDGDPERGEAG